MARVYAERRRKFVGRHFREREHFVSAVGRVEQAIREYIRNQELEDARLEQLSRWR
jgi:putative transposase